MEKRLLGNIAVSPIGMGCMGFSHGYGKIPERDYSIEAIRKAHAYGCTFFDTAETYGTDLYWEGHNEEILGEAVEPFRNQVVIATKLHIHDEEVTPDMDLYALIRKHLDASLKRLRTDYVDLYYLHRVNELVPVEDVAIIMGRLIGQTDDLLCVMIDTAPCLCQDNTMVGAFKQYNTQFILQQVDLFDQCI